jgi:tripartite-type tricarboxylate transporter receptor subunit TctC
MNRILASLIAFAAALPGAALAQDAWPARPVRIVVPSSPGGGTDTYARLLAQALTDSLKRQFVVENKPGASGNIGADIVAKSAPDGYTFLLSANPALTVNPSLFKNLSYNVERDFVPVARGVVAPQVIVVAAAVPAKTLAEFIALAKREPGKLAYGSAGSGSTTYLGVRQLEEASGAKFLHIPYKGMGQAYQDLLGGQLKFMFPDVASVIGHIKSSKAVPLAVTERTDLLPGVPTLAESGLAGVDATSSFSVVAPTGTPAAIVQRLSVEINKAMKSPALAEKLQAQALNAVFDTPEVFAVNLKKERDGWAAFIKRNGIVLEE